MSGTCDIEIFLSVAMPFFVRHNFSCFDMCWPMPNEMNTTKDESDLNAKFVDSNNKKNNGIGKWMKRRKKVYIQFCLEICTKL